MEVPLLELAYYPRFHEASSAALRLARDILGARALFVSHIDPEGCVTLLNVLAEADELPPVGDQLPIDDLLGEAILRTPSQESLASMMVKSGTRYAGTSITLRNGRVFGVLGMLDREDFAPDPSQIKALQSIALLLASAIDADSLGWHDRLTGLYTRRLFDDHLILEVDRARRNATFVAVVVVSFDAPAEAGSPAIAWWLSRLAERLRQSVRKGDTVARIGASEFGLIMPDLRDNQAAVRVARSLLDLLTDPIERGDDVVSVSPSVGVALYPLDGDDAPTLVSRAAAAMTVTRESGGDAFQFFSAKLHLRVVEAEPEDTVISDRDLAARSGVLPGSPGVVSERPSAENADGPDNDTTTPVDQ